MTSLASALPAIHEIRITDKDGNAVKSRVRNPVGLNYRERDYFQFHQTHNNDDLYVGVLIRSKIDGSVNITVSRRINKADGSFAGVVVASISLDFFQKLFESVHPPMRCSYGPRRRPISLSIGWDRSLMMAPMRMLSGAKYAARVSLVNQRLIVASMEPRGATAEFDPTDAVYTLRCGSQGVYVLRNQIPAIMGAPPSKSAW
jgi:hypothetical protein